MIQQIYPVRSTWYLHVIEVDVPLPIPPDFAGFPTFLLLTNEKNSVLANTEPLFEPEQTFAEDFVQDIIEKHGSPEILYVQEVEEWEPKAWQEFAQEFEIKLEFVSQSEMPKHPEGFCEYLDKFIFENELGDEKIEKIFESLNWLKSARVRERSLRKILERDPKFSPALVELGDLMSEKAEWKIAHDFYFFAKKFESERWENKMPLWWEDILTRPYLRACFGEAMTQWHLGNLEKAVEVLSQILKLNPKDHQGVRIYLPMALLSMEDWERTEEFFLFYEQNYPGDLVDPILYFGWGLTLHHAGKEQAAAEKYRLAMLQNLYMA
ncbi:MAG: hypothetical protein NZL93_04335, partial [Chthoniobacterales bacterium]|nr:hypothetical protein [Chthoniobacterales bacterium]